MFGVALLGRGFGLTAKCIHRRKRRQPYFRMTSQQIAFILTNMSSSLLPCFVPITVCCAVVVTVTMPRVLHSSGTAPIIFGICCWVWSTLEASGLGPPATAAHDIRGVANIETKLQWERRMLPSALLSMLSTTTLQLPGRRASQLQDVGTFSLDPLDGVGHPAPGGGRLQWAQVWSKE